MHRVDLGVGDEVEALSLAASSHRTVLGGLLAHALGKGLRCCLAP